MKPTAVIFSLVTMVCTMFIACSDDYIDDKRPAAPTNAQKEGSRSVDGNATTGGERTADFPQFNIHGEEETPDPTDSWEKGRI